VLTGSGDKTARLWDTSTGKEIRSFTGPFSSVAFSPDGARVLTGSGDKTARLWDNSTGQEVRAFTGHEALVSSVAFSPDGKRVLTGSYDKTARLWDASTSQEVRALTGHEGPVFSVAFSPDGKRYREYCRLPSAQSAESDRKDLERWAELLSGFVVGVVVTLAAAAIAGADFD
jgi:eukaryotic-like serine/threonine-protein kinase